MGKRVRVDSEELSDILDGYAQKENKTQKTSKEVAKKEIVDETINTQPPRHSKLTIASLIFNGALIVCVIALVIMYANKNQEVENLYVDLEVKDDEMWSYKSDSENLEDLLNGKTYYYVKNKLDLMDEAIVFEIEGYGNYYYTYDCMMKKVGSSEYSYWAYNKEQAIGRGLKRGSC